MLELEENTLRLRRTLPMAFQVDENPTINPEQRRAIVRAQPCFANLSSVENAQLAELLREVQYTAGDVIVREADPIDCIYFIVKGDADVRHVTFHQGVANVQSVATLKPGGTIGLNDTGFYSLTGRRTAT